MQNHESSSQESLLKRKRDSENSNYPPKHWQTPQVLPKFPLSNNFRCSILPNGDAKAFWLFDNLRSDIESKKASHISSPHFQSSNGDTWRIFIWPCKNQSSLGVFVELSTVLTNKLYKKRAYINFEAYFSVNGIYDRKIIKNFNDTFSFIRRDWGYDEFFYHSDYIHYLNRPFILEITVSPEKPHEDSRLKTGYNGIINEGTTCYANSLLQTLYFIKDFRRAVYLMPTSRTDIDKLPLSLQLVFYQLQYSQSPANTQDLLKSFGWESFQWNIQHDVQEFNLILSEALEKKMKDTPAEGTFSKLFTGKMQSFIECISVKYKSEKVESFSDLQLNVKGCRDIYMSFDKYTEIESLSGENKYEADAFGKQDARKGVIFEELPAVLQIQLKRFEYDFALDRMMKIDQRYEFYEDIDLGRYVKGGGEWKYKLFSILVHRGNAAGGHYFAYISPELDGKWFVFNDDSVDRILIKQALENSFGGECAELEVQNLGFVRQVVNRNEASAYMLVYIKSDLAAGILQELAATSVSEQLHSIYSQDIIEKQLEIQTKIEKESTFSAYFLSLEVIKGWGNPGISHYDNDIYKSAKFSADPLSGLKLNLRKSFTGKELYDQINSHLEKPCKLWVFSPGYRNWEFKALIKSQSIFNQIEDHAIFIETDEKILEINEGKWQFIKKDFGNCSQTTEILEESIQNHNEVLIIFKWYDWNLAKPLEVVKLDRISIDCDLDALRAKAYLLKTDTEKTSEIKIRLYLEKSVDYGERKAGLDLKCFEPGVNLGLHTNLFQHLLEDEKNSVRLSNGDAIIAEIIKETQPKGYIDAQEYLSIIYNSIEITVTYHDSYNSFAFQSYSSKIIQTPTLKLSVNLNDTVAQLLKLISISLTSITHDQIQLYSATHSRPTPIPVINTSLRICDLISSTTSIFFDFFPPNFFASQPTSLIYACHVDQKFQILQVYPKVLSNSTLKSLEQSLYSEMIMLLSTNIFTSIEFYLLNHPQNAIIKELEAQADLSLYSKNPNYFIALRTLSSEEVQLGEGKEKVFLYVYSKGKESGYSQVLFFEKMIQCKELVKMITGRFEEKVRVMICSSVKVGARTEVKVNRPLEESEGLFFVRYVERIVGVELPVGNSGNNQLKFK